jgi:hypothetical protein
MEGEDWHLVFHATHRRGEQVAIGAPGKLLIVRPSQPWRVSSYLIRQSKHDSLLGYFWARLKSFAGLLGEGSLKLSQNHPFHGGFLCVLNWLNDLRM